MKIAVQLLVLFALEPFVIPAQSSFIIATPASELNGVLARHSLALNEVIRSGVYKVTASPVVSPTSVQNELSGDKKVTAVEVDDKVHTSEQPSGQKIQPSVAALATALADHSIVNYYGSTVRGAYPGQAAAGFIEIPGTLSRWGGGNAIVAVIDTGVDPNHPALKNSLIPGYDFTRNIAGSASELTDLSQSTVAILEQSTVAILEQAVAPAILNQSTVAILEQSTVAILEGSKLPSDFGHGTMVAGLIHLVAPGARIMPLKAFQADGSSNMSDIVRAIYYAVDNNAKVINMSFATTTPSPALSDAIAYAQAHKVICVASAGNDGKQEMVYPAGIRGVVGVGSITLTRKRSSFSNFGDAITKTSAPGEALITTYPGNNYAGVWGTSFSSALLSGAAALMISVSPNGAYSEMSDALEHGYKIDAGMGDASLDLMTLMLYMCAYH